MHVSSYKCQYALWSKQCGYTTCTLYATNVLAQPPAVGSREGLASQTTMHECMPYQTCFLRRHDVILRMGCVWRGSPKQCASHCQRWEMGGRPSPWQPGQVPVCPHRLVRCCQDMQVLQAGGLCGSSLGRKPGAGSTHSLEGVGQRQWSGGGRREEEMEWQTETRVRWSMKEKMGRRNRNEMIRSSLADEDSTIWC